VTVATGKGQAQQMDTDNTTALGSAPAPLRGDPLGRLGLIDIGTNSVLMTIAETDAGRVRVIRELHAQPRLGQGSGATGVLGDEPMARTVATLEGYLRDGTAAGVTRFAVVATAAVREARNGSDFTARVKAATGLDVRIIPGAEEAALTFLASAVEFRDRATVPVGAVGDSSGLPRLSVVDVGGGSTEFICAPVDLERAGGLYEGGALNPSAVEGVSIKLGCVRLHEALLTSDPVTADQVTATRARIREMLATLPPSLVARLRAHPVVGCAGTLTSLKAVELRLAKFDAAAVHGTLLARDEIERQIRELYVPMTIAERKVAVAGLGPERADVALSGALVCAGILEFLRHDAFIVSDKGLRYGLLLDASGVLKRG
jgi:exopolyphosphatase / guanosine-5'-triphosphate,3'-diphosphate pyrophosphatase